MAPSGYWVSRLLSRLSELRLLFTSWNRSSSSFWITLRSRLRAVRDVRPPRSAAVMSWMWFWARSRKARPPRFLMKTRQDFFYCLYF